MVEENILVKSKKRVADHGEVFTPVGIVKDMLDLVKDESYRVDSKVLEPACGEGVFLCEVLTRKLGTVQERYGKNEFERRHYGLLGLMCVYGIELLEDNAQICRQRLLDIFISFLGDDDVEDWIKAASEVLDLNIVQANALTFERPDGTTIKFPEWGYLGKGIFQRRDFHFDNLTRRANYEISVAEGQGNLFRDLSDEKTFMPAAIYEPMTVTDIASGNLDKFRLQTETL